MTDVVLRNVPDDMVQRLQEKGFAELVARAKGSIEYMDKYAVSILNGNEFKAPNLAAMGNLGIALEAVNLIATVAGTVIICKKLNRISRQLDGIQDSLDEIQKSLIEIHKGMDEIKDVQLTTTLLQSNAQLVEDYKINSRILEKGGQIPEREMIAFIRECNRKINTLFSLKDKVDLNAVIGEIFILLPMMCNYILLYYKTYYSDQDKKHILHDDWMCTLDQLVSKDFLDQIQDYLFIEKCQSYKTVSEFIGTLRYIVTEFRKQIDQLLEDLEACHGLEGYNEAMEWSKQYVLQQAKVLQAELTEKYGAEKAEAAVKQAMQEISVC